MLRRFFLLFFVVAFVWSAGGSVVFAYDEETTHPALTDEIVDFYNLLNPDRLLTGEQKEWIIGGSIREDEWPRWLNHFYDPVRKIGWNGEHQGVASSETALAGAYTGLVPYGARILSTTEWVHSHETQAGPYARMGGDQTWEQAVKYYADGSEKEAYITLGHTLHLLEDMTVPDHSRNDSHGPLFGDDGSPLEDYLEKWNRGNIGKLGIPNNLIVQKAQPPTFNKVEDYFVAAAEYSNRYFFSKDTINSSIYDYEFPKIIHNDGKFGYSVDEDGKEFLIAKSDQRVNTPAEGGNIVPIYSLKNEEIYYPILDAYFSRLAPKAVLYGAGVIELFHKQVKDALDVKDIAPRVTRMDFSRVTSLFSFSPIATLRKAWLGVASIPSIAERAFSKAVGAVKNTASNVAAFAENIISKIQNDPENAGEIIAESAEQIENLLAGDPADGIVIDTEEERARLKELQNQLDDISDQIGDLAYRVDVATGREGRGGAQEKTNGAEGKTDSADEFDKSDKTNKPDKKDKSNKSSSISGGSGSGGGGVAASAPNLAITEIMYNASGTDDGREWIEIRNDGASSASLDDVRFLEGGTNHQLIFARGSAALAAGGYTVIADDANQFLADYPSFSGSLFDSSFSLSNDGETLALTFNGSTSHSVSYASSTGARGDGNSLQLISGTWQASTPTPGTVNVFSSSGGGSSSGGSATSTATSSSPTSGFGAWHVVISEVQTAGADAGDEFIELYNPTDAAVDMSAWSLQYAGASTAVTSSTVSKKNFLATSSIAAKSFYLVGRGLNEGADGYRGSTAADMTHRTFSLSGASAGAKLFLVASTTPIENETDAIILDALDYTSTTVPSAGQSFERKAWSNNLCHSAIAGGTGEFLGNACDAGAVADDFEIRLASNPQNSASFKEPRTAPTAPIAATGSTAFAAYDRASVAINFAWQASTDFQGATSTVSYRATNASTSASIFNGTSTSFAYAISEIGRSYSFVLQAFDRDGFGSATTSATVAVPSFLDTVRWYRDPRASSTSYVLDLSYDIYPFVPQKTSSGNSWRLPIFYKNRDALREAFVNLGEPATISADVTASALAFSFKDCAGTANRVSQFPVFPDTAGQCLSSGPSANDVSFTLLEDPSMRFTLASSTSALSLSSDDYVTLAFYDFYPFSVPRTMSFVAADMNRYRFSSTTPSLAAPALPDAFTAEFDATSSRLILRWATSTDADSLDDLITYDINFSTSTAVSDAQWVSAEPQPRADLDDQTTISLRYLRHVVPGNSFTVGLRAVDEFGTTSTLRTVAWVYPSTTEMFSQSTSTGWSDQWGIKNPPCPSCPPRASLQSIVPTSTLAFDVATVRVWEEQIMRSVMTTLRLAVFEDNGSNRPLVTNKLGEATVDRLGDIATSTDLAFTFSSPLTLATSTKYWFALDVGSVSDNAAYFENWWKNAVAGGDLYAAGQAGRGASSECTNADACGATIPSPSADADWYLKLHLKQ